MMMITRRLAFTSVLLIAICVSERACQRVVNRSVVMGYKKDVTLLCDTGVIDGAPAIRRNISFYAVASGATSLITSDDYKYTVNSTNSTLTIKSLKRPELESRYFCNATGSNSTINFFPQILPYFFIPDRVRQAPAETSDVELTCNLLYGYEVSRNLTYEWRLNGVPIAPSERITITNVNEPLYQTKINIKEISLNERGEFECVAFNSFGMGSTPIQMRVKSSLAPLWPFIGVFIEAGLVALILGCYSYRKKQKKKIKT